MKNSAVFCALIPLVFSALTTGCGDPCEGALDDVRSRVERFLADSDPLQEGNQPCVTDQSSASYDQICHFAQEALANRWPNFGCTSCDALEVDLCGCYDDTVWVVDANKKPLYPAMVYCLANYYRLRDLCECDPDYKERQIKDEVWDVQGCYLGGSTVSPVMDEVCGDPIDQNCDGKIPSCDCPDADGDGFHEEGCPVDCADCEGDECQTCGGADCDDGDPSIHPGAAEICGDGIDQDCDGADLQCTCADSDGDGFFAEGCGGNDCDDNERGVRPGAREIAGDGIDQNCDGRDAEAECPDEDGDGFLSGSCGGGDCLDVLVTRVCRIPDKPLIKEHNIQQTDVCDALRDTFGCEFYDADVDGIPDQYDGGSERADLYDQEDPECLTSDGAPCTAPPCPPTAAEWDEWFSNPRTLWDGGRIYLDSDGGPEDRDDDGLSNTCDNCGDTPNGFSCLKIGVGVEFPELCDFDDDGEVTLSDLDRLASDATMLENCIERLNADYPFFKRCDANDDGYTTLEELKLGGQLDANQDGIGDACDRDSDGVRNADDNCPDAANGFECGLDGNSYRCDANGDGNVTEEELSWGDQWDGDQDGVGDACDNCPVNPNGFNCSDQAFELNCDVNFDGDVTTEELMMGDQRDSDGDGIGDACDPD